MHRGRVFIWGFGGRVKAGVEVAGQGEVEVSLQVGVVVGVLVRVGVPVKGKRGRV